MADEEALSPVDGRLIRWLSDNTTYAGLFNDRLVIEWHLFSYLRKHKRRIGFSELHCALQKPWDVIINIDS
jgi:hypothetical protein